MGRTWQPWLPLAGAAGGPRIRGGARSEDMLIPENRRCILVRRIENREETIRRFHSSHLWHAIYNEAANDQTPRLDLVVPHILNCSQVPVQPRQYTTIITTSIQSCQTSPLAVEAPYPHHQDRQERVREQEIGEAGASFRCLVSSLSLQPRRLALAADTKHSTPCSSRDSVLSWWSGLLSPCR